MNHRPAASSAVRSATARGVSLARWLVICLAGPAALAHAHTAWLDDGPSPGRYALMFGGHAGKTVAHDPAKLRSVAALDASGKPSAASVHPEPSQTWIDAPEAALIVVEFDNGYWTSAPDGKSVNRPMNEVAGATRGVHAIKYHKRILRWSPIAVEPVGQPFELVPVSPEPPMAGQPMHIRVLIDGLPAAGVPLAFGEEGKEAVSGADGIASIRPRPGRNRLWSGKREPLHGDPAATQHSIEYSFVFDAS